MSFDKFLLAVESRDLSQADKSIIRVASFPIWVIDSRTSFSVSQQLRPKLSAKWMLSILSDLPLTKKTEKTDYFSILQIIKGPPLVSISLRALKVASKSLTKLESKVALWKLVFRYESIDFDLLHIFNAFYSYLGHIYCAKKEIFLQEKDLFATGHWIASLFSDQGISHCQLLSLWFRVCNKDLLELMNDRYQIHMYMLELLLSILLFTLLVPACWKWKM